ncbi:unnamed protein product [Spirodela intermedia]|uniref:CRAL-TRIO domain-containing protein n=1 Tax=Spirodela intermedia TaxID=51605 RepID=A0A7I8IVA8_SPIIN|nr:unnamed protein product [Spirodela intermedia]CAA6661927.1 unnamed protein product [Spirodela intermedia]
MSSNKSRSNGRQKALSTAEQRMKVMQQLACGALVHQAGQAHAQMLPFQDTFIARNWSTKKASKMLREALEWRKRIAEEAKTGKIYRAKYLDKFGRPVLVMKPGLQNTNSTKGQIRYWIYCMENCILNFPKGQEQMVVSMNVTRETAHVLQDFYPEMLGLAILYNPPKIFEQFRKLVRPFLESETYQKVKFIFSDDPESQKIDGELFDLDELESAFGGHNPIEFDYNEFQERMKKDEMKFSDPTSSPGDLHPTEEKDAVMVTQAAELSEPILQPGEEAQSDASDEAPSSIEGSSPEPPEATPSFLKTFDMPGRLQRQCSSVPEEQALAVQMK